MIAIERLSDSRTEGKMMRLTREPSPPHHCLAWRTRRMTPSTHCRSPPKVTIGWAKAVSADAWCGRLRRRWFAS